MRNIFPVFRKNEEKMEGPNPGVLANSGSHVFFLFFFSFAKRPSKQFFRHVGTEPKHPGYNQYFLEVNVSCSRTQHGDLSEDRILTSRSGVRRFRTRPPRPLMAYFKSDRRPKIANNLKNSTNANQKKFDQCF